MAAALRQSLLARPPLTSRFRRLLHDAPADQTVAKMKKLQDEQQDWDAIVRMMVRSKLHSYKVVQLDRDDDPPWASRAFRVLLTIAVSFTCGCNLGERIYHKLALRTNRP